MYVPRFPKRFFFVLAVLLLSACEHAPVAITEPQTDNSLDVPSTLLLRWSCYDPLDSRCINDMSGDPDSTAPGVYLAEQDPNTPLDPQMCFVPAGSSGDMDYDGLSDHCEDRLAFNFRPELRVVSNDDTGREPYWAARPAGDGVRIAYLISYYVDIGPDSGPCSTYSKTQYFLHFGFEKKDYCNGHFGDSEFIVVDVTYNYSTSHWALEKAFYSAHWNTGADASKWRADEALQFPDHYGWFPRSWVAYGKHANYPTETDCNAGAFGQDDCPIGSTDERLEHVPWRNLGSSAFPLVGDSYSCVESQERFAGNGRVECYWKSGIYFEGWQEAENGYEAGPYIDALQFAGF